MSNYGLHWFRRDLRIAGNEALQFNWKKSEGRVLGIFCFDKKFLSRPDFSVNRFQFFIESLVELKKELQDMGSDLLVLDVGPFEAFPLLLKHLYSHKINKPNLITWNRDYEPFARERDAKAQELFLKENIEIQTFRDHLLIEPEELSKDNGEAYQVYTPFSRKWMEIFQSSEIQKRLQKQKRGLQFLKKSSTEPLFHLTWTELFKKGKGLEDHLEKYRIANAKKVSLEIPKAGSAIIYERLSNYKNKINKYAETRDFPSLSGTSRFSMYLKNGSLSVPQIISFFNLKAYKKKQNSQDTFLSELIWREFYYHILYHFPYVEQGCFIKKYDKIKWQNNEKYFQAWKEGLTGCPIVDAGMRELKQTGWMHNRVRMIVASFLTKDLLIDWRWGEKYFMEQLLDGDLAPNNGGWQWAASTGCDPQPYFRIFNPWLQSKKFDPQGEYIKKYVPELSQLDPKKLHEPIYGHKDYPSPIVDHSQQRINALKMYEVLK